MSKIIHRTKDGRYEYPYEDETGKHKLMFWAEMGMIHIEDDKDGSFRSATPSSFLDRAAMLRVNADNEKNPYHRDRDIKFFFDAVAAVKTALKQGDLSDPHVREHLRKHGHGTTSVSMGGGKLTTQGLEFRGPSTDKRLFIAGSDQAPDVDMNIVKPD